MQLIISRINVQYTIDVWYDWYSDHNKNNLKRFKRYCMMTCLIIDKCKFVQKDRFKNVINLYYLDSNRLGRYLDEIRKYN